MIFVATIKLMKRFFPTQASCIDVSHKQKKQTKSGECHPGYKGKKCENRECDKCFSQEGGGDSIVFEYLS